MINTVATINIASLSSLLKKSIDKRKKSIANKLAKKVSEKMRGRVRYIANELYKTNIANYAPSHEEEEFALTIGISDKGKVVGYPTDSSRFFKGASFKYLKDAIMQDAKFSVSTVASGDSLKITIEPNQSSLDKINDEIGFSWLKKISESSVQVRSTRDGGKNLATWGSLLDKWEFGSGVGAVPYVYTVRPRDRGAALHPGPDKRTSAKTVTHTIKPYRMFYKGMREARKQVMQLVKEEIRAGIK